MKRMMILAGTAVALLVSGALAAADGKATYDKSCAMCHKAMPPKMGDKAAWAPLIAKGADELTASVIKGKGKMKPRGGAAAATDEDIKAAVEYIISQNK
jgi:cytochrome c5